MAKKKNGNTKVGGTEVKPHDEDAESSNPYCRSPSRAWISKITCPWGRARRTQELTVHVHRATGPPLFWSYMTLHHGSLGTFYFLILSVITINFGFILLSGIVRFSFAISLNGPSANYYREFNFFRTDATVAYLPFSLALYWLCTEVCSRSRHSCHTVMSLKSLNLSLSWSSQPHMFKVHQKDYP